MKATVRMRRGTILSMLRTRIALAALFLCCAVSLAQNPVEDPEGKEVADVIPQYNRLVPTEKIVGMIKTKPGMKYSRAVTEEDTRILYKTNFFADVRIQPVPTTDGRVVVYYQFKELPSVVREIIYKGAKHLKTEDLETITNLRKGMPMNPIANKKACHDIVQRYHEKGRMLAYVELLEGKEVTDTRVVFNITEGAVAKIRSIDFVGHQFVSGSRLETQLVSSKQWLYLLGGDYNPAMLDLDVLKLKEYYKNFGYHDVEVSREVLWDPNQKHVRIIFHIKEGPRYQVAHVSVHGNSVVKEPDILRLVKTEPGETYDRPTVEADLARIRDYYGYRGYGITDKEELFWPEPGKVDVHYEIEERPPARVGQFIIVGNEVTRQNVILRQVPLYPGQILTYPDLRLAEKNLARLNIFENNPEQGIRPTVTVLDPESDTQTKDIQITVHETQTGSLLFGIGVNSDAGLTGSIVLNERNFDICRPPTSFEDVLSGRAFRGAGQEFRMEAVPGTQLQRYTISFREPSLLDSPYSLGVSGYYYTRIFTEYNEQRLGTRETIGRRLDDHWNFNTGLRVEEVGVFQVPPSAPLVIRSVQGDNFLVALRAGVNWDTRDSYLRPTEGSIIDLSYEQVMGEFTFPVGSLEMNKYWRVWERPDKSGAHVLAARSQFSVTGANAPVYERLYAGGFRTLRGFQFRGVGPNTNGFMVGGDFMFLNSLEYQVPIKANDQIYLVAFVDSGTVESSVAIRDYRVSAGVGARIVLPMLGPMPIALDFGFPINRIDTDREQIFSFWVGFFH